MNICWRNVWRLIVRKKPSEVELLQEARELRLQLLRQELFTSD